MTLTIFQSTRPSRASTFPVLFFHQIIVISIHKALTGLDCTKRFSDFGYGISIHKALTGLDGGGRGGVTEADHFNPQGPHGPRLLGLLLIGFAVLFQSTRPSRASTFRSMLLRRSWSYFNPQGPHGPRLGHMLNICFLSAFQSTRPSRASTNEDITTNTGTVISIHKALTGLDGLTFRIAEFFRHFNPQGPHGPRRSVGNRITQLQIFQSTRPSRASTAEMT